MSFLSLSLNLEWVRRVELEFISQDESKRRTYDTCECDWCRKLRVKWDMEFPRMIVSLLFPLV